MSKKRQPKGCWFIVLLPIFLLGFLFVFNQPITQSMLSQMSTKYSSFNYSQQALQRHRKQNVSFDYDAISLLYPNDVMMAWALQGKEPVIGDIAIPSLKIHLPIIKGVSPQSLAKGACTMKANEQMGKGNYALAGHNMNDDTVLFSPLRHIKREDVVYVTDTKNVYIYRVIKKYYVWPSRIDVIQDGKNKTLTLVTCSMDGKKRLIVEGRLISITPFKQANASIVHAFHQKINK